MNYVEMYGRLETRRETLLDFENNTTIVVEEGDGLGLRTWDLVRGYLKDGRLEVEYSRKGP